MKLSKNKKGGFGFILTLILIGLLLIIIGTKLKPLLFASGNLTDSIINKNNSSMKYAFFAEEVIISDSDADGNDVNECTINSNTESRTSNEYTCNSDKDIYFETSIYNSGEGMLMFHGGIIVCSVKCNNKNACSVIDKTCFNEVISSTKTCSVKIGGTVSCDAGSYKFNKDQSYYIYPVATCLMDSTNGCYESGMVSAAQNINVNKPIKITGR
jgi:hypothetical protein